LAGELSDVWKVRLLFSRLCEVPTDISGDSLVILAGNSSLLVNGRLFSALLLDSILAPISVFRSLLLGTDYFPKLQCFVISVEIRPLLLSQLKALLRTQLVLSYVLLLYFNRFHGYGVSRLILVRYRSVRCLATEDDRYWDKATAPTLGHHLLVRYVVGIPNLLMLFCEFEHRR
jgi:hypothetical protein